MSKPAESSVTAHLHAMAQGEPGAKNRLWSLVYAELHGVASAMMRRERPDHTLQPTALVNEIYGRLLGGDKLTRSDRAYFFAAAGQAMRRILIDHARKRKSLVRGGDRQRVPMTEVSPDKEAGPQFDLEALGQALDELDALDPELARIVDLRCLAGLTIEDVASLTDLSPPQVKRRWALARGWLQERLEGSV